jgi:hypothetical protein
MISGHGAQHLPDEQAAGRRRPRADAERDAEQQRYHQAEDAGLVVLVQAVGRAAREASFTER